MMTVEKLLQTHAFIEQASDRMLNLEDTVFTMNTQIDTHASWGHLVSAMSYGEAALITYLENADDKFETQIVDAFKGAKHALSAIKETGFDVKELQRLEKTVDDVLATYDRVH